MTPLAGETIYGKSLKLAANGKTSITAPNGVGRLSFSFRSTGAENTVLTLTIDGTFTQNINVDTDTSSSSTVSLNGTNRAGTVDIVIETTKPIVIDMLKWANYP